MLKRTFQRDELAGRFPATAQVGEVFRSLEAEALTTGLIVCRFSLNGLSLSENEEKKFAKCELSEISEITVEMQTPEIILSEVLNNWLESLPKMMNKADALAQVIRIKGLENNFSAFVDIIDSCQFLVESLISLRSLCQGQLKNKDEEWKKSESLTVKTISEALASFEKKDLAALADVLEYDLGHCLQSWLETLTKLRDDVRRNAAKESSPSP